MNAVRATMYRAFAVALAAPLSLAIGASVGGFNGAVAATAVLLTGLVAWSVAERIMEVK